MVEVGGIRDSRGAWKDEAKIRKMVGKVAPLKPRVVTEFVSWQAYKFILVLDVNETLLIFNIIIS